ncbi:MAG: tRNA pseudouridine(55) synthase TruB, partial [Clostridia bacterium]|nr:tRNA pseudouridine(55) synthase TruB [Clostridia bacterium]
MSEINGIIIINKERDYTSHDVVARVRGILSTRKVGHTGTLDPDATGVLPVCIGKGTKVSDMLTFSDKEYVAEVKLGVVTDTQDIWGTVKEEKEVKDFSKDKLSEAIEHFTGEISQIPPMYSAIKINGRKMCDLAREGIEVERKARNVTIY